LTVSSRAVQSILTVVQVIVVDEGAGKGFCAKPTIAKIHGAAVAGGSDIALWCDLIVMAEDARIGYMPGCPTTAS
jgi:1,4-dihydroxy-2-naphthoyl-CoA synthase